MRYTVTAACRTCGGDVYWVGENIEDCSGKAFENCERDPGWRPFLCYPAPDGTPVVAINHVAETVRSSGGGAFTFDEVRAAALLGMAEREEL